MKVIDHEPAHWFLFKKGSKLFLDGNYSYSFCGYSFMIELNEKEESRYKGEGKKYIKSLVNAIQDSCPNLKDNSSVFKERRVKDEVSKEASKAVEAWREENKKKKET